MNAFQPAERLRAIPKSPIRHFFDRAPAGSVNLGLGEPDLPTPACVLEAAARVLQQGDNGYTSHAGLPELRERVASDYPSLRITGQDVIITAGSQEALYLALMTLVDEGDEVLIPDPGFVAYRMITQMAGGRSVFYRMPAANGFRFDADEFRRNLSPKTRVVVCTSPSNPTGQTLSRPDLETMAGMLEGTGAYVISDEIYRDLYFTPQRPASISEYYPRTIVVSGLSKSMRMTGWRLGWLCGCEEVVRSALILHGYVTTCASTISQKTALSAWTPAGEDARMETRSVFYRRRNHLMTELSRQLGLTGIAPEGAFYTLVDVRPIGNALEIAEAMLEERVITVPGSAFGPEGEGFLRVSFCADFPMLTEGVRRMSQVTKGKFEVRGPKSEVRA